MNQRGINKYMIDLLLNYGEVEYHKGKEIYSLYQSSIKGLASELCIFSNSLSKLNRVYVVAKGSIIITVAYRKHRFKRNR